MRDFFAVVGFFTCLYLMFAGLSWLVEATPEWLGAVLTITALFAPVVALLAYARKLYREAN
jgi:hypothetical protein